MDLSTPLLRLWLKGTTCYRHKREVLFENDTHIVLKHTGHSEYIDRGSGTGWCPTYAVLYSKDFSVRGTRDFTIGYGHLMKWEGRLSLARIREDCRDSFYIEFPPASK